MTTQIRRSDFPDYWSYMNAIAAPIGGADPHIVWDEVEQEWVLDREDHNSTDGVSAIP